MDLTQKLRNIVRAIVGMPEDPGQPPQYDRMAWYRATVTSCAADGSTCDVQPEDPRISGENGVKVLVGVPGLVGVVAPGAIVHLGWEKGDPSRPRVQPIWESGATVTKLTLNAVALELAGNTYSVPQWENYSTAMTTFVTAMKTMINALVVPTGILAPAQATAAAACDTMLGLLAGATFKSTKVKNG